ncbi:hypothetical protein EB651_10500 [Escherichia coli]|nr:hypothetical protein [Escherichia coli]
MSKIDYQALRAKAEKATCGEWSLEYGEGRFDGDDALIHREAAGYIPICRIEGAHPESGFDEDFQMEQQANAEFIAAASPATVLALLDEREADKKRIAELEAREIKPAKGEVLVVVSGFLERLNDECLNPLIDRAFSMMVRKNMLPPPPDAMEGMPLKVEYISVMAQAQKSIGLSSLASTVNFIGQLAQAKPEALDKLNVDQAIDAFADMSGVSPTVIVPQEQVEQARQQRAQQQQQQQMMAMGMAAAQGAKTLSEAKTSDPSVLSAMANAVSGQGGQSQ